MGGRPRILIPGGSGVFGRHLARELLATTSAHVVLAGRDLRRAEAAMRDLGEPARTEAVSLDLADAEAFELAARGCFAVACTAGPFQGLPDGLPLSAVRAGAHWLDIGDDPGWVLRLIDDGALGGEAAKAGLAVMPGLSAVPAVSGVLARWCRARLPDGDTARVTLFIGNRNEKGTGATASALIGGFRDPIWVELPFGRRKAHRFPTPDAELFRRELGVSAEFRVALEWAYLGRLTAALGRLTSRSGPGGQTDLARRLSWLSRPFDRLGSDLGCVQVELWKGGGPAIAAAAVAGQCLVVLPCALALQALLEGRAISPGVAHPAGWTDPDAYLSGLMSRGVRILTRSRAPVDGDD